MIRSQEKILKEGILYRFRMQPVDPYDAFRGRFIALTFEAPPLPGDQSFGPDRPAYVKVGIDSAGYAALREIGKTPFSDDDFIKVRVHYVEDNGLVHYSLPDDLQRYYLNEKLAPEAEKKYFELNMGRRQNENLVPVHAEVRILNGRAAIQELYFEGTPVDEYVR